MPFLINRYYFFAFWPWCNRVRAIPRRSLTATLTGMCQALARCFSAKIDMAS